MSWRQLAVAGAAVVVVSVSACGSSFTGSAPPATALSLALSRVTATAGTRAQIYYDETAALVKLTGAKFDGFGQLTGMGASGLQQMAQVITTQPGIDLFKAAYTISAGLPPHEVGLLAGGQQGGTITDNLTKMGWRRKGDGLVGPSPLSAGGDPNVTPILALNMAQVRSDGSDLVYGESGADLSLIGNPPSGPTLAADPTVRAAADCLGDVVAADILAPYPGGKKPTVFAAGVRRPKTNTDTPHVVVCVGWADENAAHQYATTVQQLLTSGTSMVTDERYDALLRNPVVHDVGGDQHLVEWEADTKVATTVFSMINNYDVPGLPNCQDLTRLSRAAAQQLAGLCP